MSRTDVHRPAHVQLADPYNRHRVRHFQAWPRSEPILVPLYQICGCSMCSGQDERRALRRRERHGWRRQLYRDGDL